MMANFFFESGERFILVLFLVTKGRLLEVDVWLCCRPLAMLWPNVLSGVIWLPGVHFVFSVTEARVARLSAKVLCSSDQAEIGGEASIFLRPPMPTAGMSKTFASLSSGSSRSSEQSETGQEPSESKAVIAAFFWRLRLQSNGNESSKPSWQTTPALSNRQVVTVSLLPKTSCPKLDPKVRPRFWLQGESKSVMIAGICVPRLSCMAAASRSMRHSSSPPSWLAPGCPP
mmetsp:Transcript_57154/g.167296  ORF Transcript_57154/g.167296 Transcript_57154/m.167296 type:complete len:229 (+) Transcript_57154:1332-2018(+)